MATAEVAGVTKDLNRLFTANDILEFDGFPLDGEIFALNACCRGNGLRSRHTLEADFTTRARYSELFVLSEDNGTEIIYGLNKSIISGEGIIRLQVKWLRIL